MEYDQRTAA
jgi:hypothetical protein